MEQRVAQALCDDLLDRFMAALNAHDSAAMDACMHFRHARRGEWRIQARSRFGP